MEHRQGYQRYFRGLHVFFFFSEDKVQGFCVSSIGLGNKENADIWRTDDKRLWFMAGFILSMERWGTDTCLRGKNMWFTWP